MMSFFFVLFCFSVKSSHAPPGETGCFLCKSFFAKKPLTLIKGEAHAQARRQLSFHLSFSIFSHFIRLLFYLFLSIQLQLHPFPVKTPKASSMDLLARIYPYKLIKIHSQVLCQIKLLHYR